VVVEVAPSVSNSTMAWVSSTAVGSEDAAT